MPEHGADGRVVIFLEAAIALVFVLGLISTIINGQPIQNNMVYIIFAIGFSSIVLVSLLSYLIELPDSVDDSDSSFGKQFLLTVPLYVLTSGSLVLLDSSNMAYWAFFVGVIVMTVFFIILDRAI